MFPSIQSHGHRGKKGLRGGVCLGVCLASWPGGRRGPREPGLESFYLLGLLRWAVAGGAGSELVPIFPLKLLLRRDSSPRRRPDIFSGRGEVQVSPVSPHLPPHTASGAGLGGLGGQGLPHLHGPPIPSSLRTPGAGGEKVSPSWVGRLGRDVPSPAWRSPGMGRKRHLWTVAGTCQGNQGGPSPPRGRPSDCL